MSPDAVSPELEDALEQLSPDQHVAFQLFWHDIVQFANQNRDHLTLIEDRLRKFANRVFLIIIIGGVLMLLLGIFGVFLQDQIQSGRKVSLEVTCAVQSAIAQAGRATIAGSPSPPPSREEQALEALGFPTFAVRHAQSAKEAKAYVKAIATAVDKQIGSKGDGLVTANGPNAGQLDCNQLQRLAKVNGQ